MCIVLKYERHCIIIPNFTLYEEWVFATLLSSCHVMDPHVSCGNKIRLCVMWFHMPKIKILCFRCPCKVALAKQELRIHCSAANYGSYACVPEIMGKLFLTKASSDTAAEVLWILSVITIEGDLSAACSSGPADLGQPSPTTVVSQPVPSLFTGLS